MTVSSTTNKISYSTGGGVTSFAYTYPILKTSDLTVILKDNATLVENTLSITTHYSVSRDAITRIGNVTTVATYAAGYTLIIKREVDLKQETDYTEGGAFPASSHEDALDKLTMIVQQLQEEVERCIIFSAGSLPALDRRRFVIYVFNVLFPFDFLFVIHNSIIYNSIIYNSISMFY